MSIFSAKMSRRGFLFTSAALALSACQNRTWDRRLDPESVLSDLRGSSVIEKVRAEKMVFFHKDLEPMTFNGKNALTIVQRGLFALELVDSDPGQFNFGVYGPKTTRGILYLQEWGGVSPSIGRNGRRFEKNTLLVLEAALENKINNRWNPPRSL